MTERPTAGGRTAIAIVPVALVVAAVLIPGSCERMEPQENSRSAESAPAGTQAPAATPVLDALPEPSRARSRVKPALRRESDSDDDTRVAVRFRVLRPDGSPAPGARVIVFVEDIPDAAWRVVFASDHHEADDVESTVQPPVDRGGPQAGETDGSGTIAFRLVRGAIYSLGARLGDDFVSTGTTAPVDGAVVEVRLRPGVVVSGVAWSADGEPIEGALVRADTTGWRRDRVTDSDGTFETAPLENVGGMHVSVSCRGYRTAWHTVAAGAKSRDLAFVLSPTVTFRGRVLDESGEPVRHTWILLYDGDQQGEQRVETDDHGRFAAEMDRFPPGDVLFIAHEFVAQRISNVLAVAGVRDVGDVVVARGGSIRGTVVREDGTTVWPVQVFGWSAALRARVCAAGYGPVGTFTAWPVGTGSHRLIVREPPPPGVAGDWGDRVVGEFNSGMDGVRVVLPPPSGVVVRLRGDGDGTGAPPRVVPRVRAERTGGAATARVIEGVSVHTLQVAARPGEVIGITIAAEGYERARIDAVEVPERGVATRDVFLVPASD